MPDRLYRSRHDRMLFGVAGGMARSFNVDPAVVRLVWVLLVLAVGAGVLLYIAAAIVIPEEPTGAFNPSNGGSGAASGSAPDRPAWSAGAGSTIRDNGGGAIVLGLILVVVGGWFLLDRFIDIDGRLFWPAAILVVGLVLVLGSLRGRGERR